MRVAGKFFFAGERKLPVRGVTYGTFPTNDRGEPYPEPLRVRDDFRRMAAAGFTCVRTYTVPPRWLLDVALDEGLRVMVGIPWEQHVAFLDDEAVRRRVLARIRQGVGACAGHPAVLSYAVGNEIPAPIVRWSGRRRVEDHLRTLYEAAKETDPDVPVTYVNYPSTEYLDLPFLDFLAFNVFLEDPADLRAYLGRLQNLAHDRPLVLTEVGLDSQRNGEERQARLLEDQIRVAAEEGCAGTFVFAWTDEWERGGWPVTDWDFGLTRRDRSVKPALGAVRDAMAAPLAPASGRWPGISVVICAYNGEPWIEACVDGALDLDYPDYEVIVVDDGSTDGTAALVQDRPVRFIQTANRGLSCARNTGIEAATGEIVAFLDVDAWPDEDWLTQLALAFESTSHVGIGGPNIPPPKIGATAACVANAPGNPQHVLRTDREADHIPGCNMAFRKEALEAVGGFLPVYRVAGDDVDICWRIQERGWTLGFAPGAVVWHHPRDSVTAFWRQQRGYGAAEALLERHWPEKYNAVGHVTWGGRVYGPPTVVFPGFSSRIYQGTWGQAAFQRQEARRSSMLWGLAAMPEWYLGLMLLAVLSLGGLVWPPLLVAVPFLLGGSALTVVRAVRGARRARFPDDPTDPRELRRRRRLVAFLHLMQPAARLAGRFFTGLVPWRARARPQRLTRPRRVEYAIWREEWASLESTLRGVESTLRDGGSVVRRGGGYDRWDLQVEGGALGFARLRSTVEEHGRGRQMVRARVRPRLSVVAWVVLGLCTALALLSALDGETSVTAVLGLLAAAVALRGAWEAGSSTGAFVEALDALEREAEETIRSRSHPAGASGRRAREATPSGPRTAVGSVSPVSAR